MTKTVPSRWKRIAASAAEAALVLVLVAEGMFLIRQLPEPTLPSYRHVRESFRPSEAVLLDRHGAVLDELRVDPKHRRLEWTGLSDISPSLRKAVIASEDRRFRSHHGVDWLSLLHAAWDRLFASHPRGASTISMQLASLLDARLQPRRFHRTLRQKWEQIETARGLERRWTKDQILEAYLNLVSFRGELQGISAAARGLFDREPSGLGEAESLLLASLIRSPNAPAEEVLRRAERLAARTGWRVPRRGLEALSERLSEPYSIRPRAEWAPHVARMLLRKGGEKVRCTIDAGLQAFAAESLARHLDSLRGRNARDGAVLVVANRTGEILAYVGNRGSAASAPFVDGIVARRQAGSTLKPFLYGLAIERKLLTAASLLDDSPIDVPTKSGLYVPKDYDRGFHGLVSVRTGLSSSLNVPAVRTLRVVGPDRFVRRLAGFGFEDLREGEDYGLSLALGTADVSLYELVNAYRALANGGRWSEMTVRFRDGRSPSRRTLSKRAAFIISDILSDRGARTVTFGLENPLATPYWTAVKTGTSKDMRDNWCIGYSKEFTVGVWVGNFSGEPMWKVSGISGTAPVWAEIMDRLHRGGSTDAPAPPPGLIARRIGFRNGIEPARREWFLPGTEPAQPVQERARGILPRIAYPAPGTIVALDPDIPAGRQRIFFEAKPAVPGMSWVLNGEKVGTAEGPAPWTPSPGRYSLALVDGKGVRLDEVAFSVRGAVPANDIYP